jgi:hypothetical protein
MAPKAARSASPAIPAADSGGATTSPSLATQIRSEVPFWVLAGTWIGQVRCRPSGAVQLALTHLRAVRRVPPAGACSSVIAVISDRLASAVTRACSASVRVQVKVLRAMNGAMTAKTTISQMPMTVAARSLGRRSGFRSSRQPRKYRTNQDFMAGPSHAGGWTETMVPAARSSSA